MDFTSMLPTSSPHPTHSSLAAAVSTDQSRTPMGDTTGKSFAPNHVPAAVAQSPYAYAGFSFAPGMHNAEPRAASMPPTSMSHLEPRALIVGSHPPFGTFDVWSQSPAHHASPVGFTQPPINYAGSQNSREDVLSVEAGASNGTQTANGAEVDKLREEVRELKQILQALNFTSSPRQSELDARDDDNVSIAPSQASAYSSASTLSQTGSQKAKPALMPQNVYDVLKNSDTASAYDRAAAAMSISKHVYSLRQAQYGLQVPASQKLGYNMKPGDEPNLTTYFTWVNALQSQLYDLALEHVAPMGFGSLGSSPDASQLHSETLAELLKTPAGRTQVRSDLNLVTTLVCNRINRDKGGAMETHLAMIFSHANDEDRLFNIIEAAHALFMPSKSGLEMAGHILIAELYNTIRVPIPASKHGNACKIYANRIRVLQANFKLLNAKQAPSESLMIDWLLNSASNSPDSAVQSWGLSKI